MNPEKHFVIERECSEPTGPSSGRHGRRAYLQCSCRAGLHSHGLRTHGALDRMSQSTNIEWTDATWNPVRGCSRVSAGCQNCYAEKIAARFSGRGGAFQFFADKYQPRSKWTGKVELIESKLLEPLHWKKPRRVFVNSMSDLFHENLPDESIDRVFAVMALTPHITYQVLTKRARRMREYLNDASRERFGKDTPSRIHHAMMFNTFGETVLAPLKYPLSNVWLGVSVENQPTADERIPELLATPAALRFVSYEPALAQVDFWRWLWPDGLVSKPKLDWGIIGGESGPGARPFQIEWAQSAVSQFKAAGVPIFVKQLGANPRQACFGYACEEDSTKGGNPADWPREIRVREFPTVRTHFVK